MRELHRRLSPVESFFPIVVAPANPRATGRREMEDELLMLGLL